MPRRLSNAVLFDEAALARAESATDDAAALAGLREALQRGRVFLNVQQLQHGAAAARVKYHARLLDRILQSVWRRLLQSQLPTRDCPALVATGGYGRGELNLHSDADLLLLLPGKIGRRGGGEVAKRVEAFIRFCWDLGLSVGHGVRSAAQCKAAAKDDLSIMTSLLEARLLAGDAALFAELESAIRDKKLWPAAAFLAAKLQEQNARHLRYGDTAYNLEPNLKESRGGLRDLHTIAWVANRHFGSGRFADLKAANFLTEAEYRALIRGRDFLWQLRDGLHKLARRCEDRLLFDYQRELAKQLGFVGGENHLAVESLMKKYYRGAGELRLLNELLLQHFQEAILPPPRAARLLAGGARAAGRRDIGGHFRAVGDFLEARDDDLFCRNPNAMLEMFYALQRHPKLQGVRAGTVRQLRANLHRVDDAYRASPDNCAMFLAMFRHQHGLTHALRRMNRYGMLGAFFPAFGEVVGQMQHDLFHVYTVDAHSLFVVRNLRRFMLPKYDHESPLLSELMRQQSNRERLFIAALCHDIGKGSGRDHSEEGAEIAHALCARLGMSEYDAGFVAWLVRHHLLMSATSQREDVTDPRVAAKFAEMAGEQQRLDGLYLLTVADMRGTSPKVWNEWKGRLLATLYSAASRKLRSGLAAPAAVAEVVESRKAAIVKLTAGAVDTAALQKLWAQLGDDYFLRNGPQSCAWHAREIASAGLLDLPLAAARWRAEIEARQVLVLAAEAEDLLLRVAAALDKLHWNVFDARIHPMHSGLSLLVFIAAEAGDAADENAGGHAARVAADAAALREFLLRPADAYRPVSRLLPRAVKQFRVPTTVSFSPAGNGKPREYTAMEVVAQDRPGLLYWVARALLECKVRLVSAKVSTVGERAEDTFFISDRDGRAVDDDDTRECLRARLQHYLAPVGDDAK